MSQYVFRQRRSSIELGGRNWMPRLLAHMFAQRPRTISIDRLPDYLLRDAGLERIGGVTHRRIR